MYVCVCAGVDVGGDGEEKIMAHRSSKHSSCFPEDHIPPQEYTNWDFPGGASCENLPANAGDTRIWCSILG